MRIGDDYTARVGFALARKRFSDEDVIRVLRQIAPKGILKIETASEVGILDACRSAGVSDVTYYK